MSINNIRITLWSEETKRLLETYQKLISDFDLSLISMSTGRIVFGNGKLNFNFLYAFDRYQIDVVMPMAMISISDQIGTEQKVFELINKYHPEINIYDEFGKLNNEHQNHDLSFITIIEKYLYEFIESEQLFK